jgi:hypothetical protein
LFLGLVDKEKTNNKDFGFETRYVCMGEKSFATLQNEKQKRGRLGMKEKWVGNAPLFWILL